MKILRRLLTPASSRREAEKIAVDTLLLGEFGPDAYLTHAPDGHPVLTIGKRTVSISISHCRDEAVVAISDGDEPIGVDIETARQQLRRVAPKFLNNEELNAAGTTLHSLLRAWTAKEAVYKAALTPGLPLHDIRLDTPSAGFATARGIIYNIHYHLDTPDKVIAIALPAEHSSFRNEE